MITSEDVPVLLGAVVQPKTKEPVWVRRQSETYRTVDVFLGYDYQRIVGTGYLDGGDMGNEYLNAVKITGFPRSHTPSGVAREFKGMGFGTCLYTGLVLIASAIDDGEISATGFHSRKGLPGSGKGICSDEDSRSEEASEWWRAAVKRGLAQQEDGEKEYADDDDAEEETLEDEDLDDYMSMRSRRNIYDSIAEAVSGNSEWYPSNIRIRGDVTRTVESSGSMMTADYYTLSSAEKHKLVAVRETFQGRLDGWAKSHDHNGMYDKDVILALNVSNQSPLVVGRLADCARHVGATEVEITALLLRNRFGVDLLNKAIGRASPESMRIGARTSFDAGGVMIEKNPRRRGRRGVPSHEPRPGLQRNPPPEPSRGEQRELDRAIDELKRRRDDLGWNDLESLP